MLGNDPELPQEFRDSVKKWGLPKDEFTESSNVSPQISRPRRPPHARPLHPHPERRAR